jgi:hypothetical protein
MDIKLLPLSGIFSCIASIIVLMAVAWNHGSSSCQGPAASSEDYAPILFVATAALALLYAFYWLQSYTCFAEYARLKKAYREKKTDKKPSFDGIKYGTESKAVLAANRCAGNLLEQMVPFLVSMFAYATFVSAGDAAKIGWTWFLFRSYYIYAYNRFPFLFASTIPAYVCVWYMLGRAVYEAATME